MSIQNQDVVHAIKKHPVGFGCAVLAVALAAATYLRSGGVEELEIRLEERAAAGERQQANLKNASLLQEHLGAVTTANEEVGRRTIDPQALANNLQHFYELEAGLGVRLIDLRQGAPRPKAAGAAYRSVPYNVAIDGTYPQIVQFLRQLEHGRPFVRFDTITIMPTRTAGSAGTYTLSLTLDLLGQS